MNKDDVFSYNNLSVNEIIFELFYSILLLVKGFGLYEGQWPFDVALIISCIIFVIHIMMTRYNVKSFIVSIALLILGILTVHYSNEYGALLNIMVIVGMNGISSKKIIRISAYLWSCVFTLQCFLVCSGIRSSQIFRIHRKLGHYIVRWSMGFTHPNVFHISYFILLCFLLLDIRPNSKKMVRFAAIAMLGNILIFLYSFSFTGVCVVTVFLAVCLYIQHKKNRISVRGKIFVVMFPLCCALFSVAGPVVIKGKAFNVVNHLLSTRFELSRFFLTTQKIGLWGTSSFNVPDASYSIDSSYVYALMHYGIIYFCLFVALLTAVTYYVSKENKYEELCVILGCCLAGITEPFLSNTSFKSIIFIFIGEMIYLSINEHKVLNSTFIMLKVGEHKVHDYAENVYNMKTKAFRILRENSRKILLISIAFGMMGCVYYGATVNKPQVIYASPWDCDLKEGSEATQYVYYETVKDDSDAWILSNRDKDGKLYDFNGFTVDYEYYRRMLGVGYCWFLTIMVIQIVIHGIVGKRDEHY